ncbi:type I-C CRISPR-associated protein Cas7/Csd2 [Candidatus Competibacter phosphatis]|uniref:Type I-C CRISPR-associated protein Cas7/Csd2 n=1 Tax=Candidatus Competibacter phosphatis TaxID=221280 RepID=A0ABX1TR87_9GAMM|nr:type I-C CRISPR-associated protein Cas7/Csd2 [Candidatus Competibacter phosphatis]NMQ21182.1 type I-C CRISPR-associated protein Cas7/Csd2 [Candidatus Competibacter phosphatis]
MNNPIKNRCDFVLLFDVIDGNPNGDPDAGNMPRMDPQTGHGLVTDVCLKRKVRNYIGLKQGEQPPFEIYVKEKAVLNRQHERAYAALGFALSGESGKRKGSGDEVEKARVWMCSNFYDVRTFGAVMSTGVNCGQVRGPVQLTFARSMDPITPAEHSITRMAVATEKEAEAQQGDNRTMGRKFTVPYGLYRAHGFISAHLAAQTGFSDGDLGLLWEALGNMFEHDHSAARGQMTTRGLYVFQHDSALGNAPAHRLFERITVNLRDPDNTPRAFDDYTVAVDEAGLPEGIALLRLAG